MATRRETAQRRSDLLDTLRQSCRDGSLKAGQLLPSVRELSQDHKVSVNVVCEVLAALVEEGLLRTVPRVGTFVGRAKPVNAAPTLMIRPDSRAGSYFAMAQLGFETRLGQLGGASLCLTAAEFRDYQKAKDIPELAGVFAFHRAGDDTTHVSREIPYVGFGDDDQSDCVEFDNVGGGTQAVRHLWELGHRDIAFLGLHGYHDEIGPFTWSAQREAGWQTAMAELGRDASRLCFRPLTSPPGDWHAQALAAQEVAVGVLRKPNFSAIITANSFAVRGVLNALLQSGKPFEKWPAIMCFDTPETTVSAVSCIQQPWDEIGREAAQVLWDRHNGRLSGPPQRRLVAMRLIPRLTSRPEWASSALARNRAIGFVPIGEQGLTFGEPALP